MKKLNVLLFISLGAVAGLSSCNYMHCLKGSGHMTTETRKMTDFDHISISGGFKVILKQDSSLNVTVTADDNLQKNIETEVDSHKLHILSRKSVCNSGDITITVGVRNLQEIKAQGAIEITGDGKLNVKDIEFNLSGATKITLDLNADNVTTSGSGDSELDLKGQATSHKVDFSGSGQLSALDFVVSNYELESSGSSEFQVNALQTLKVSSSGSASVKYKGHPAVTSDKSGSLTIEQAQ